MEGATCISHRPHRLQGQLDGVVAHTAWSRCYGYSLTPPGEPSMYEVARVGNGSTTCKLIFAIYLAFALLCRTSLQRWSFISLHSHWSDDPMLNQS